MSFGSVDDRVGKDTIETPAQAGTPMGGGLSPDHRLVGFIGLLAIAVVTCLWGLGEGPRLGDHESINALAARQSMLSGQWLIPQVGDVPRIRKTPLGIWLIGVASYATRWTDPSRPVDEFSARLPSALAALATVLVVAWLGSMLYGSRIGLIAGFIIAGCVGTVIYARNAQVETVLTFFTSAAFGCFWRGMVHDRPGRLARVCFYVTFALAMLAKAPLPLATIGLSLVTYWFIALPLLGVGERGGRVSFLIRNWFRALLAQFARLRNVWLVPGIVVFVVVAGAWPLYVYLHVDNAVALWRAEYLDRFTGVMSEQSRPAWYYLPILFGLTVPYMLSLPEAVAATFLRRYRQQRPGLVFAFTWAIVSTVFLSMAAFKRPHYLLSALPAYALLLAPVVDRVFFGANALSRLVEKLVRYGIPALLAILGIGGGAALYQTYPMLLVPYVFALSGAWFVWDAACRAYVEGRRASSFLLMNLGVPILILIMWPAVGRKIDVNPEATALIAALREYGIGPRDEIYWVEGRPNSAVEFYSGIPIRRLIHENEMAGLQRSRRDVSDEAYVEIARRIHERLQQDRAVYMIVSAKSYDILSRRTDLSTREMFRLIGIHPDLEDALVVFTQGRTAPSEPPGDAIPQPDP